MRKFYLLGVWLFIGAMGVFAQSDEQWTEVFSTTFPFSGGSNSNIGVPNQSDTLSASSYTAYMQRGECSNLYAADGALRVGTTDQKSLLTFVPANLSGKKIEVTMKVKGVAAAGNIIVRLKDSNTLVEVPFSTTATEDWQEVVATLEGGDFDSQLQIFPKGEGFFSITYTPFYIQSITVRTTGGSPIPTTPTIYIDPDVDELVLDDREVGESTFATSIVVKSYAMQEAPTYELIPDKAGEKAFTATGQLTKKGGVIEVRFTPERKGIAHAQLVIKSDGCNDRILRLKGRGLGESPLTGMEYDSPLSSLDESFDNVQDSKQPQGWTQHIARGYEDWKPLEISENEPKQRVMSISSYNSGYDLATAYLRTPALVMNEGNKNTLQFTLCIPPCDVMFASCFLDVFLFSDIKNNEEYKLDTLFTTESSKETFDTPKELTIALPDRGGVCVVAFCYRGAGSSEYSRQLYIDNVKITGPGSNALPVEASAPVVVRHGDKIVYRHTKGLPIQLYTAEGHLLLSRNMTDDSGELTLPNEVGRVIVVIGRTATVL